MFTMFFATSGIDVSWPGLIVLGFLTGIITGLLGIGGGFILTPALRVIFDIPYPIAIGSSLMQIMLTTLLSSYRQWLGRGVDVKLGLIVGAASLLGVEGGIRILTAIKSVGIVQIKAYHAPFIDLVLSSFFVILLAAVAAFMLFEGARSRQEEPKTGLSERLQSYAIPPLLGFECSGIARISAWIPVALGVVLGTFAGLLGIGGGFIGFPLLVYLVGVPTRLAVGTNTLQVLIACCYGVLRHSQEANVDFSLVFWMMLGSVIGIQIGVRLCAKTNARRLRKYFALLLLLAMVLFLYFFIVKLHA